MERKSRNRKVTLIVLAVLIFIASSLFVNYHVGRAILKKEYVSAAKKFVESNDIQVLDTAKLNTATLVEEGLLESDDCSNSSYVTITNSNGELEYTPNIVCKASTYAGAGDSALQPNVLSAEVYYRVYDESAEEGNKLSSTVYNYISGETEQFNPTSSKTNKDVVVRVYFCNGTAGSCENYVSDTVEFESQGADATLTFDENGVWVYEFKFESDTTDAVTFTGTLEGVSQPYNGSIEINAIDKTPPSIVKDLGDATISYTSGENYTTGESDVIGITDKSDAYFTVTGPDGYTTEKITKGNTYTITPEDLANGEYTITAVDAAGNTTPVTFIVDKQGPSIYRDSALTKEITGTYTTKGDVRVYFGEDVVSASYKTSVDGEAIEITTASYPFRKSTDEAGGVVTYYLTVKDAAGNPTDVTIIIDTVEIELSIKAYETEVESIEEINFDDLESLTEIDINDTTYRTKNNVLVVISANKSVDITNSVIDGIKPNSDQTAYGKLITKNNGSFTLKASDDAGHTATDSHKVTYIDRTAPKFTGVTKGGAYSESFSIGVTDASNVSFVVTDTDGNKVEESLDGAEITIDPANLANGLYTATATDAAGNETVINFTIDTEAPKIYTTADMVEDTEEKPNNVLENGSTLTTKNPVRIYFETGATATYKTTEDGEETSIKNKHKFDTTDTNDSATYYVTVTDKAGNSTSVTIIIDKGEIELTLTAYEIIDGTLIPVPSNQIDLTNPNFKTNKDVLVVFTGNKDNLEVTNTNKTGILTIEDGKAYGKIITKNNGTFTLKVKDTAGNTATASHTVTYIDKAAPVITGVEDGKSYNNNVTIGITDDASASFVVTGPNSYTSETISKENTLLIDTETFEDGDYTVTATDSLGQEKIVTFTIDTEAPRIYRDAAETKEITADSTFAYKARFRVYFSEAVNVSYTTSLEEGAEVSEFKNKANLLFEASDNEDGGVVTYYVTVTDAADNSTTVTLIVDTIEITLDLKAYEIETDSLEGINIADLTEIDLTDEDYKTNKNVLVVYTANKGGLEITNTNKTGIEEIEAGKVFGKIITANNGEFTLKVKDAAGHTASDTYEVTFIDRNAPKLTETIQPEKKVNEEATITLKFDEAVETITGEGLTFNKVSDDEYKVVVTADGTYNITVTDKVGNSADTSFTVTDAFDREKPIVATDESLTNVLTDKQELVYNYGDIITSKKDVIIYAEAGATAIIEETGAAYTIGSKIGYDEAKGKYIDGVYTIVVSDEAGNTTTVTVTIDITRPSFNIKNNSYHQSVELEVTGHTRAELVKYAADGTEEWRKDFNDVELPIGKADASEDAKYTVYAYDENGNTTKAVFWIDNVAPVVTDSKSQVFQGKDQVGLYNSEVSFTLEEGATAVLESNLTKTYESGETITVNASDRLVSKDAAGNETVITITFDTEAPEVTDQNDKKFQGEVEGTTKYTEIPTFTYEDGATIEYKDASDVVVSEITTDGTYTVTVTDVAGNSTVFTVLVDTTYPVVSDGTNTFQGKVEGTKKYTVIPTFTSDGNETIVITDEDGNAVSEIGNGTYIISATDDAGNTTTFNIAVDTVLDYKISQSKTDENYVVVTITPTNGEKLTTVIVGDTVLTETDGKYTYTESTHGTHSLSIYIEDDFGNYETVTETVVVDTQVDATITYDDLTADTNVGVNVYVSYTEEIEVPTITSLTFNKVDGEDKYFVLIGTNGTYTIVVEDKNGNKITENIVVDKIDIDAPVVTDQNGKTFEGEVKGTTSYNEIPTFTNEEGLDIVITQDGVETTITTDGTYTVTVTDAATNVTTFEIVVDTDAPVVTDQNDKEYKGKDQAGLYNSDVTFILETGATAVLQSDLTKIYTDADTITVSSNDVLVAKDAAGNETIITITFDREAPVVTDQNGKEFQGKVETTTSYNEIPTFTNEEGLAIVITQDGVETTITADGTYTVTVTDAATNVTTFEIIVDTAAPVVATDEALTNVLTDEQELVYNYGDIITNKKDVILYAESGATAIIEETGAAYTLGSKIGYDEAKAKYIDGVYTIVVSDTAGNTTTVTVTIDITRPTFNIANNSYHQSIELIIGGYDRVDLVYNDDNSTLTNIESGQIVGPEQGYADGKYTAYAYDNHNNVMKVTFYIDNVAPVVTDGTNTFQGLVEGTAKYNVIPTFTADGNEAIEIKDVDGNVVSEIGDGTYTISATDAVGNTTTFTIAVDRALDYEISLNNRDKINQDVVITVKPINGETLKTVKIGENEFTYADGVYTYTVTEHGTYSLEVYIEDTHGNNNNASLDVVEFEIDKKVEFIATNAKDENKNFVVTVTAAEGETLKSVKADGNDFTLTDGVYTYVVDQHGPFNIEVSIEDAAGNTRTLNFSGTIDKLVEYTLCVEPEGTTNKDVVITVTPDEGETLKSVTIDGNPFTANEDGTYTYTISTDNGTTLDYNYTVTVTDEADNSETETVSGTIDKVIPVVTDSKGQTFQGKDQVGLYNADVTFTLDAGTYAMLQSNINTTYTDADTITVTSNDVLIAKDLAGNETVITITFDREAPVVTDQNGKTFQGEVEGTTSYNVIPTFTYEDGATIEYKDASDAVVSGITTDGTYTVTVTDTATNKTTFKVKVDSKLDISITNAWIDGNFVLYVTPGATETLKTVTADGNDFTLNDGVYSYVVDEHGSFNIEVYIADEAGNTRTMNFNGTVDKKLEYTLSVDPEGTTNQDVVITVTPKNGETLKSVTINGNDFTYADGVYTYTISTDNGTTLDYNYTVTITDKADNRADETVSGTIDKKAPALSETIQPEKKVKEEATITLKFDEAVETITGEGLTFTKVSDIEYTVDVTADGTYNITVTDELGNSADTSFTVTDAFDNLAPVVATDEALTNVLADEQKLVYNYGDIITSKKDVIIYAEAGATATIKEANDTEAVAYELGTKIAFDDTRPAKEKYADGEYTIVVSDEAGNTTTITIVIDVTRPTLSIGNNTYHQSVDLVIGGHTSAEIVKYAADETTIEWRKDVTEVEMPIGKADASEDAKYTVYAYDENGNTMKAVFWIDNIAPVVDVVYGTTTEQYSGKVEKEIQINTIPTVSSAEAQKFEIKDASGNKIDSITAEGTYTVTATDKAKNETTLTINISTALDYEIETEKQDNNDVVITVTPKDGETLKTVKIGDAEFTYADGVYIYTETAHGTHSLSVYIEDTHGNNATETVTFEIDKMLDVSITNDWVDGNFVLYVTPGATETLKIVTANGNDFTLTEGVYTYVVDQHGPFNIEVTIEDEAGNTRTLNFSGTIDKDVEYTLTGNPIGPTNQDVVITVTPENGETLKSVTIDGNEFTANEDGTYTYTISTDNGTTLDYNYTVTVTDEADNSETETVSGTIDKEAPIVTDQRGNSYQGTVADPIRYNDSTITLRTEYGATFNFMGIPMMNLENLVFSGEGTYPITVSDAAGNVTSMTVVVDITPPVVTDQNGKEFQGEVEGTTSYNVIPTFTYEDGATIEYKDASDAVVSGITTDGTYTVTVTDTATNKTTFKVKVDSKLDISITNDWIDGNFVLYVTPGATETLKTVTADGNDFTLTDGVYSYVVDEHGSFNIEVYIADEAGNTRTLSFNGTVDKKLEYTLSVDPEGTTNQDVVITVTPKNGETLKSVTINGNDFTYADGVYTYTISTDNGTTLDYNYTVTITDKADNRADETVSGTIDKEAPVIRDQNNTYVGDSSSATMSLPYLPVFTTEDGLTLVIKDAEGNEIDSITEDGTYTASVSDNAGNKTAIKVYVDANAPELKGYLTSNNGEPTNENVTVALEFTEALSAISSGDLVFTKSTVSDKIYNVEVNANGTYQVNITDTMGHTATVEFTVTGIDKDPASVTESYATNPVQELVVTLTFSEEVKDIILTDVAGKEVDVEDTDTATIKTATLIANGTYTVTFNDLAENPNTYTFTIDGVIDGDAPVVTDTGSVIMKTKEQGINYYNAQYTNNVTMNFEAGATATLSKDGATPTNYVSGTVIPYEEGTYELVVEDAAENKTIVVFKIDTHIEALTINPEDANATAGNVTLLIECLEPIIITNSTYTATATDDTLTKYTMEATNKGTVTITYKDLAGNATEQTYDVTNIDREHSGISGVVEGGKYNNKTLVITFAEVSNVTLTLPDNTTRTYENVTSVTLDETFADGPYKIEATDTLGNSANAVNFIIDRTKPVIYVNTGSGIETSNFSQYFEATKEAVSYTYPTAIAKDDIDGEFTAFGPNCSVDLNTIGVYTCTYSAMDDAGNIANPITLTVTVDDQTAPIITLNGEAEITIPYGKVYKDAGATASDSFVGTITPSVDNPVNPYQVGTYYVTYTANDGNGNDAIPVVRTVHVVSSKVSEVFRNEDYCAPGEDCYNVFDKNNNYIWYSGHLWRVIKVNADGTVKIVTEDTAAGFAYDDESPTFSTSHAYEWLNNYFYSSLNNAASLIVEDEYCNKATTKIGNMRIACTNGEVVSKVGLLTLDEYNILGGASGFLNTGDMFYTMTPYDTVSSPWVVAFDGSVMNFTTPKEPYGYRPVVTLNADVEIASGKGTIDSPYILEGDTTASVGDNLNSAVSGQYVSFAGQKWRIVRTNGEGTRLILDSYIIDKDTGAYVKMPFGVDNVGLYSTKTGVGAYLNGEYLSNYFTAEEKALMIPTEWYYNRMGWGQNPLTTTLAATEYYVDAYVGLSLIGDLMSGSSSTMIDTEGLTSWSVNSIISTAWYTTWAGTSDFDDEATVNRQLRPIIKINFDVDITGGQGTVDDPYRIIEE